MTLAPPDQPIPDQVLVLAQGRTITPVWRNGVGGTTWLLNAPGGSAAEASYLKIGPPHAEFQVADHLERLAWVGQFVPAPRVLASGEIDGLAWFETASLPGHSAVSQHFGPTGAFAHRLPELAAALGAALRHFHDAVPVAECRWTWSVADRLAFRALPRAEQLESHPPLDLVVCHGDACNPNFLFDDDLQCTGYVDLGQLGVADRWADIAAATRSLRWNLGEGFTSTFLGGYGVALDEVKLAYYQDFWAAEEEAHAATTNDPHHQV